MVTGLFDQPLAAKTPISQSPEFTNAEVAIFQFNLVVWLRRVRTSSCARAKAMNQPNGVASALGSAPPPDREGERHGDAVMIRSIINTLGADGPKSRSECCRTRHERSMTVGATSGARIRRLQGLIALLRTLLRVRRCRYNAILNFEQNFPRLNLALMTRARGRLDLRRQ